MKIFGILAFLSIVVPTCDPPLVGQDGRIEPAMVSYARRPIIVSPDGKWRLSVGGRKRELPWLMFECPELKLRFQEHSIERYGWVLWRPDSQAFAFTDARYSNHSFVMMFYLNRDKSHGQVDLSPLLDNRVHLLLDKDHDIVRLLAKGARWVSDRQLLVAVYAEVIPLSGHGARGIYRGYILDVDQRTVVSELSKEQLKSDYQLEIEKIDF